LTSSDTVSKTRQMEPTQISKAARCSMRLMGARAFTRVMRIRVKSPLETGGGHDNGVG
jgi:hypothetical protein